MNYPDKDQTMKLLAEWQRQHESIEKLMAGIQSTIGLDPNGPMFDTVWRLFDTYSEALSAQVGDFGAWLAWFQMENDMGAKGMAAGYDGKTKPNQDAERPLPVDQRVAQAGLLMTRAASRIALAAAIAADAPPFSSYNLSRIPQRRQDRVFTHFDEERLRKAEEKRARRAAKRTGVKS